MIKNIIFDIGEVIFNCNFSKYLEEFNFTQEVTDKLNEVIFETNEWDKYDRGVYYTIEDLLNALIEKNHDLKSELKLVINKNWINLLTVKKDTIEYIKELKNRGYSCYILSNIPLEAHVLFKELGLADLMDGGIYSYELKLLKPEKEIYTALLEKCGLKATESIFLDDKKINIEAANNVGIHGIVFDNLENAKKQVENIITENK